MKLITFLIILFSTNVLFAVPESIRCISLNSYESFREIHFVKINGSYYKTKLTHVDRQKKPRGILLAVSRLYIVNNELYYVHSEDLVVEFDIISKFSPTREAQIQLFKYGTQLEHWLCKGYF